MKKELNFLFLLVSLLAFGLVLAGCPTGSDDGGGGGGNKVTILNSTTANITGIIIKDDDAGDYLVGSSEEYETVTVAPGETYESPEITGESVSLTVKMAKAEGGSDTINSAYQDVGSFEVVVEGTSYKLKEK
jgi:hypothetical protein